MQSPQENYQAKVLYVDDEKAMLSAMRRFSEGKDWDLVVAASGEEGLEKMREHKIDVVISDLCMPGMSGSEFLSSSKIIDPGASRILLSGYADLQSLSETLNRAGLHNFIEKPWDENLLSDIIDGAITFQESEKERKRLERQNREQKEKLARVAFTLDKQVKEKTIEIEQALTLLQNAHGELQQNFHDTLDALTRIIEWKEGRDDGHSRFVAKYSEKLAQAIGLPAREIEAIHVAGQLHRIGTIALPDEIREKPIYSLTEDEKKLFQRHTVWGEMALSNAPGLKEVAKIIRHQLEWVNGRGFPDKLYADKIPLGSKIVGMISDFYEVFNGRKERNLRGFEDALNYLQEWSGKCYDAELVRKFLATVEDMPHTPSSAIPMKSTEVEEFKVDGETLVLCENIVLENGSVLLGKGTPLCDKALQDIRRYEKQVGQTFDLLVCVEREDK